MNRVESCSALAATGTKFNAAQCDEPRFPYRSEVGNSVPAACVWKSPRSRSTGIWSFTCCGNHAPQPLQSCSLVVLTLDVDSNRSSPRAMSPHDNDPRPVPPVRPSRDDCCKGSCDPCIFDVYDDALDRYWSDLQAWEERQARRKTDVP